MIVHQLTPSAVPGDAVSAQAFAWRSLLQLWGYDGEVLAEHVHRAYAKRAYKLRPGSAIARRADAFVLHYSLWSRTADVALAADGPLALCYHNITPGHLLRPYNPGVADLCDRGRSSLPAFSGRVSALIADSDFNAAELAELGLPGATVVPLLLPVPVERPSVRAAQRPTVVLSVGRIAPNKRLEDLISAFARFQRERDASASLVLIGSSVGFERYEAELRDHVRRVGADRVTFTGRVARAARDNWYRRATVYASTSVHEGFCAPLVEALSYGIPVVARDAGAVLETLGDAGLVVEGADPSRFSDALAEATTNDTRSALVTAAGERLRELAPERTARRLRAALEPILG
jgi:glycosyltransferase involved in cell wall biosynthesis